MTELTDGVPIPSDYQWHYDPTPLHKFQELVDGLDWISETYIFGGYARALLGYPPFPEREKFGPGHDIDFVISPKYPEALEMMRKEGIQPWEGFTKHMGLEKAWEWHEKEIKKGFLPISIMEYMLEKQEKIGPYYLSWGWEKHMIDFETDMPIIRIKPKPLIVYQKSRLEKSSSNLGNPGDNEEEECDFCGEKVEYKFPFKIGGLPVEWHVCSNCLETLRRQLKAPTPKEKTIHAPKEAYVFPALCQFCGKSIEFNPDTSRFTEKVYTLDMLYYFVDICEPCTKEMLIAVEKAETFGVAGSNPTAHGPVVPYWVIPATFTTVFAVVCFVGWVASELEKGLKQKTT